VRKGSRSAKTSLTNAYVKWPFAVRSLESETAVGTAEQDFRGEKTLVMESPAEFFMLDFGANSLGIDMGRDTDVLKLVLNRLPPPIVLRLKTSISTLVTITLIME